MGKRRLELMMAVLILAGAFYVGRLGAQMRQMRHQTTAAVSQEAKLIILDEPTSSLTDNEVEALFRIVRDLRDRK